MNPNIKKYLNKLISQGLTTDESPLFGSLDVEIEWNRFDKNISILNDVINTLGVNSLLFSRPKEPYYSIINYLTSLKTDRIIPKDSETRTFLHELPIIKKFDKNQIIDILKQRKIVLIKDDGIITRGDFSPEQAFVFFSSVCFASFVKFFSDYLLNYQKNCISKNQKKAFNRAVKFLPELPVKVPILVKGPFIREQDVLYAITQAGKQTVSYGLVDSYFGNISYSFNAHLYISQTGSSLDELDGTIDSCPLNSSSCTSLTASSEFSAHKNIVHQTDVRAILHGHPKFSVILSMLCDKINCKNRELCNTSCSEKRSFQDIPIVSGEVGRGPYGLYNTVPKALKKARGVIVYGHGVFTKGEKDFNQSFNSLLDIEKQAKTAYFKML